MRIRTAALVLAAVLLLPAAPLLAQETREAEWAAEQAKKATELKAYQPSAAEIWFTKLRRELLELPSGVYPYFGSVYSGGGFTLGAGYRQFYGDRTHADVKGLYSFKGYKLLEFSTDSWGHAQDRLDLHARVGWRDATQVAYYGLGTDTPNERSNFRMKQLYLGGDLQVRPVTPLVFGAGVTYEDYTLESGTGNSPSIEDSFTPATAPDH